MVSYNICCVFKIASKYEGDTSCCFLRSLPSIKYRMHGCDFLMSPAVLLAASHSARSSNCASDRQQVVNPFAAPPPEIPAQVSSNNTLEFMDPATVSESLRIAQKVEDESCTMTQLKLVTLEKTILDQLEW